MKVFITDNVQDYYQNTNDDGTWIEVNMNELQSIIEIASRTNKDVLITTSEL